MGVPLHARLHARGRRHWLVATLASAVVAGAAADAVAARAVTAATVKHGGATGELELVTMYDDGQNGDAEAADGVFTAKVPSYDDELPRYVFSLTLTTQDAEEEPDVGETPTTLVINELMASNDTAVADPQGDYDDWIELLNTGTEDIDLSGMYLSDKTSNPLKWRFPEGTTIAAGAYLLVWADDDAGDSPGLHTNFRLSSGGENVVLSDIDARNNAVIDSVEFPALGADVAYGRSPEGTGAFQTLDTASPGEARPVTPQVTIAADGAVTEGGTATFTVTARPAPTAALTVNVAVTQGASDDYLPSSPPTSVTVPADATETTLSVAVPDDDVAEDDGVMTATIESGAGYDVSTPATATLAVRDDDSGASATVVINELMASNDTTAADPQGDYDDWIELYNLSSGSVDLSGMYLSDDRDEPKKWEFPAGTTIAASGRLLVWADDDGDDSPGLHTSFKLSAGGESVVLSDTDANSNAVLDSVDYPELETDQSYGRDPEGTGPFRILDAASPGTAPLASADATLASLSLTGVDFAFASATRSYAAEVAHAVSTTTVEAETTDADAQVAFEPADADGLTEGHQVALGVGATAVTATVTAADGTTTQTYTVTVTRAGSADAALASLSLTGVDIGTFDAATLGYAGTTEASTTTVAAAARDAGAEVAIAPADADEFTAGHQVSLAVGASAVTATVTATDGATTRAYTVTVTRIGENDAGLESLALSDVDIGTFDTATLAYTGTTTASTTTVTAVPKHSGARAAITPADADGTTVDHEVSLAVGETTLTVKVTAADGTTTKTYTVAVTRADVGETPTTLVINEVMASNDATLADPQGEYDDWIEFMNTGAESIDLAGMYLSDDRAEPLKWQFPAGATIAAGGYLLVWADDDDGATPGLHASFKLSGKGESVVLSDIDARGNVVIDSVDYPALEDDQSYGRSPDGTGDFGLLDVASPGAAAAAVPEVSIAADGPATEGGTASFTVTAKPAPTAALTVNVAVTQGASDDYLPALPPTSVAFVADAGEATLWVALPDDALSEANGVLTATLATGTGYALSTPAAASLTVRDDDGGAVTLAVNELMASNDTTAADPQGEYDDWIELYNLSSQSIDLAGMYLSDDREEPKKWQFPAGATIAASSRLLVWADDDDGETPGLHTNFKLSGKGESVVLSDTDANSNAVIDAVDYPELETDQSYGRDPEGTGPFRILDAASPGTMPAASDDATLASLALTGVDFAFASATTTYAAAVAHAVESTTVTARTSHADAEVAIAPADADGATPEHQVALAVGDTVVTVTVTAADGATTETYTVTVTRAKSDDATLASLALAGVDFGTFASGTTTYAAQVANDVESTTVAADATHDDARVDIAPGDADAVAPGHQVSLAVGDTRIAVTVTAADGAATATYTVTVTRVGSADAALSSLSLTGVDLGSFDPATLTYSAVTELSTLTVAASAAGAGATVSVPGGTRDADGNWPVPLAEGDNEIAVTVTAQDGTTRTYTVSVRRAPAGTATCRDGTALADPEGNPGLVRDCETLLSLKDELDPTGDMNWGDQPGFRRLDLGEWDTVAVRDGRVRGIAWDGTDSSISLRGVLPAALGELDALEVLRLDSHGLRGGLPASLGRLSRLEVLDLGYNWWMDEEPLPAWLGELTSLRRVRLHAHAPGTVPDSWSSLTRLEDLELYAPTGATGAAGPVASWLGDLPALRRLVLLQRRSTGRIPLSLAREFDELDLRMNALAGCVPAQLAESENARASEQGLGAGRYRLPACALSVDAGAGGEVSAGATAELSATASGHHGDATLVWSWTQESGPSVALTDAGTATPSFAVPARGAADAEFAFSVSVHDAEATSGSATATVAYRLPGFAGTAAPAVSGPVSHAVVEGDTAVATLAATDADTAAERLSWRLSGGSDASHFALGGSGSLSFVSAKDYEAPDDADGDGTYAVSVEVSDGLRSATADLTVALVNRNEAPTAEAGPDQSDVSAGATVTLSGSVTDPDAGDALSHAWTQVSGASVELSSPGSASATFAAPASGGALTFRLRATDAGGLWGEDETTVTVLASADARLRSLALSDVDFGAFDAETLSYAAAVEGEVESTTVAAAAWEPAARVEISPSDADGGAADHQVALAVGETVVSVTVTAADGTTTRTYAVTVTRVSLVSWGDRLSALDVELDGIGIASGVWSDGDTVWVSDWEDPAVRAYALAGGARRSGKDLTELPATRAAGLWSDGSTLWVADFSGAAVHARDLSTGAAASGGLADLDDDGNATPTGVWSDGATLWVSDYYDRKAYAYARSDGARTSSRDVALSGVGRAFGLWSAGGTLLAADWTGGRVRAYRLSDGTRLADLDIDTKAAGNAKPMGLWSDGETLWVSDEQDDRLYAYAVPAPSGQDAKSVARFAIPDAALSAALGAALDAQGGSRDPGALTSLDLSDLGIADLTGIEAATALRTLDVSGNAVVDLGPLSRLHALAELDVGRNLHLRDLAPLASLRNLRVLRASDNAIADVSPLGRLTGLAELDLSGNMIRDASPLAALGGLSRLDLGDNAVADLAPLAGLGAGVVLGLDAQLALPASSPTAYFADAQLRAVVAAALGKVPDAVVTEAELGLLTALDAPVPGLADLRDLGRATRLRALRLEGGRIADLWPLAELGGLRRLGLPGNAVRDVTALAGLGGLRVLDLSGNAVSDLRPLSGLALLEHLDMGGNPVEDVSVLGDLEGLVWLRVPDAGGVPAERLARLRWLSDGACDTCPADDK